MSHALNAFDLFLRSSRVGFVKQTRAAIAQLGERQTEDLEVPGSIPGFGILVEVLSPTVRQGDK